MVGAGAWGTALAHTLAEAGHHVRLWARREDVAATINHERRNPGYTGVAVLSDRLVAEAAPGFAAAVLTGPTFAHDLIAGRPTAATLARMDPVALADLQAGLNTRTLRLYGTDDVIGAQVGGAVKNVIAIACGTASGLGLGESARAALMTRGLAEMRRLCIALGGRAETLLGLCGVGDLTLTCASPASRNFSLGQALAAGDSAADVLASRGSAKVTEGVATAAAITKLSAHLSVEMPIALAVHHCTQGLQRPCDALAQMLDRPAKLEAFP